MPGNYTGLATIRPNKHSGNAPVALSKKLPLVIKAIYNSVIVSDSVGLNVSIF